MKGLEVSIVRSGQFQKDLRCDAQFFRKAYLEEDQALHRHALSNIGKFAFVTDGPHGYHEVDEASPIAMLTAKCAANWFADRDEADTIAKWVDDDNSRSSLKVNDLILSTRGTVGNCAIVIEEVLPANIDQDVARIAIDSDKGLMPQFVLAYLNSRFGQDHITRHSSGMVQQGMSLEKVRDIPIPILEERLQVAVSAIVSSALEEQRSSKRLQDSAQDHVVRVLGLANWTPPESLTYTAHASGALAAGRLDAQYFMPAKEQVRQSLAALPGKLLSDCSDSIRDQWLPDRAPPTTAVRNYDVTDALVPLLDAKKRPSSAAEIGSMKKVLKDGDVVISRLRAYLKEIAVVHAAGDVPSVGSSEFIVLRTKDKTISPETLMVFLRSTPVQTILKWCQDGSQHPRFSEGDLLSIPVPNAVAKASPEISAIIKDSFAAFHRARNLLDAAKRAVEIAIQEGETVAIAYLDEIRRAA